MISIHELKIKYSHKIDSLDLDLLICRVIKKKREFILIHPDHIVNDKQQTTINKMIARRLNNEPLAYILGEKEFYGLEFKVNRHTLIPRPETELMVELALKIIRTKEYANNKATLAYVIQEVSISERAKRFHENTTIRDLKKENRSRISDFSTAHTSQEKSTFWDDTAVIDVGTGSGNIIISILKNLSIDSKFKIQNSKFFAVDISKEALRIAKKNAENHYVHKKINFLHGNLLDPILKSKIINNKSSLLILANLPYLSKNIYDACTDNVKKYEPRSALYSDNYGLAHYNQLLNHILELKNNHSMLHITCLMEISPEQKKLLLPLIGKKFSKAKIEFKKDLASKWRVCKIEI
jgi:release factor glutamine methyltransferase